MDIILEVSEDVTEFLAQEAQGADGARMLEKIIEDKLLLPLSELKLQGQIVSGTKINLEFETGGLN